MIDSSKVGWAVVAYGVLYPAGVLIPFELFMPVGWLTNEVLSTVILVSFIWGGIGMIFRRPWGRVVTAAAACAVLLTAMVGYLGLSSTEEREAFRRLMLVPAGILIGIVGATLGSTSVPGGTKKLGTDARVSMEARVGVMYWVFFGVNLGMAGFTLMHVLGIEVGREFEYIVSFGWFSLRGVLMAYGLMGLYVGHLVRQPRALYLTVVAAAVVFVVTRMDVAIGREAAVCVAMVGSLALSIGVLAWRRSRVERTVQVR